MVDFNATLSSSGRRNCNSSNPPSKDFHNFVYDNGLCDMRDEAYPNSSGRHLYRMRSNHRPLLFCIGASHPNHRAAQFRYFSGWSKHEDFDRFVKDNWVSSESLSDSISRFTSMVTIWNKSVFEYIGAIKGTVMVRLRGAHKSLNRGHPRFLIDLEAELLIELENLLNLEEKPWKKRSRSDCISQGDRNTKYFHKKTLHQKLLENAQRPIGWDRRCTSWCSEIKTQRSH
ncbi:uncharacterized protein LOC120151470 [Hibiscus syriacus]|uniref:uncharacterized protein LOC120151470 n=1 Tax=Hibiscus syriacus TaxID=106335 RepID=UPI0019225644|nr:uncharacterized protein LOC120151470 [Hibiscus syriacus]